MMGLMGQKSLGRNEGLLLTNAKGGIHTCFMRFAIDVAYLSESGTIVAVRERMRPWSFWIVAQKDAVMALEVPEGRLSETKTEVGDQLVFQPSLVQR